MSKLKHVFHFLRTLLGAYVTTTFVKGASLTLMIAVLALGGSSALQAIQRSSVSRYGAPSVPINTTASVIKVTPNTTTPLHLTKPLPQEAAPLSSSPTTTATSPSQDCPMTAASCSAWCATQQASTVSALKNDTMTVIQDTTTLTDAEASNYAAYQAAATSTASSAPSVSLENVIAEDNTLINSLNAELTATYNQEVAANSQATGYGCVTTTPTMPTLFSDVTTASIIQTAS